MSDGGRLVPRNINAGEIAVNKAFNFVTKHAMHIPVLKLLPCTIHHPIKKTMSALAIKLKIQLGTGAQFGCSGAPSTGGGAQIIGGGARF